MATGTKVRWDSAEKTAMANVMFWKFFQMGAKFPIGLKTNSFETIADLSQREIFPPNRIRSKGSFYAVNNTKKNLISAINYRWKKMQETNANNATVVTAASPVATDDVTPFVSESYTKLSHLQSQLDALQQNAIDTVKILESENATLKLKLKAYADLALKF